jgi:hypothetical protein
MRKVVPIRGVKVDLVSDGVRASARLAVSEGRGDAGDRVAADADWVSDRGTVLRAAAAAPRRRKALLGILRTGSIPTPG